MHAKFITTAFVTLLLIVVMQIFWPPILWSLLIVVPLILVGVYDMFQSRHTIWRIFLCLVVVAG